MALPPGPSWTGRRCARSRRCHRKASATGLPPTSCASGSRQPSIATRWASGSGSCASSAARCRRFARSSTSCRPAPAPTGRPSPPGCSGCQTRWLASAPPSARVCSEVRWPPAARRWPARNRRASGAARAPGLVRSSWRSWTSTTRRVLAMARSAAIWRRRRRRRPLRMRSWRASCAKTTPPRPSHATRSGLSDMACWLAALPAWRWTSARPTPGAGTSCIASKTRCARWRPGSGRAPRCPRPSTTWRPIPAAPSTGQSACANGCRS